MKPLDPISVALSGTQLVEASAGTGKTYAIATLYVRLLLEARLNVSQILVVTYTNAATAELRLRIRKRLRDTIAALDAGRWEGDEALDRFIRQRCALGDAERQRDRLLLLQAVHAFDEAAIFTIHGFCERVLRENAFESGAAFETELLADVSGLVDEIVKDFWVARLHDAAPDFVRYLTSKGEDGSKAVIPAHLTTIAARVLTYPDIEVLPLLPAEPVADETLPQRVLRFQREFVDYARLELRRRKDAARVQSFDDLLQRLRAALAGPGGEELAEVVRRRYHAALIDEFQDTDPVQYDIFRRLYGQGAAPLFLIGDPKQAIYGFRGADVFTYMDAKRDASATHTLLTNRRSDPSLLRAINTIFEAASPAFLFEEIGYDKLEPPPAARERLGGSRRGQPPFEILFLRRDANVELIKSGLIAKPSATEFVTAAVASRVVAMLREGVTVLDGDVERPLASSDIAVLCRKNAEAHRIQESLRQLGVHAVLQTDASVFETAEAVAVERTLRAMADPANNRTLRAALSSSLIGLDAAALAALESDEQQWDGWARHFREWHDRWLEHGFIAAFRSVLDELEIERQLLALPDGERRLTDVLHLAELLHRAGVEQRLGPEALIQWLARMRTDMTERSQLVGEAGRIRLESDEAAVKLVTIHRSKGLEYPVVFCPFSWDGKLLRAEESRTPRFHDRDDGNRLKLDLGSPDLKAHHDQAAYEALAENLRLLYVAFTRARHYCGVVWGAVNGSNTAALTYLFSPTARARAAAPTKRAKKGVKPMDDEAMVADLQALAATSDGGIGVLDLRVAAVSASSRPAATAAPLQLPPIRRREYSLWRTSSFSGLIAAASTPIGSPDDEGIDHDTAVTVVDEAGSALATSAPVEAANLPFAEVRRGARTGDFVHRVLEKLDFQIAGTDVLRARLDAVVPRTPAERASFESLVAGIDEILDVPLGGVAGAFKLRQLAWERRLNELEFILPVAGAGGSRLTVAKLAAVFAHHAVTPVEVQYAQRLGHLGFTTLEGYLKGFVDLVFENGGKWYVVDYKTNFLGPSPSDYVPEVLPNAMAAHHYPLQYHLYTVALHRYLTARMPGYDYDTCFGGVYYLFLRGMSPRFPSGNGIWHDRPRLALVEDLAALFAQPSARGDRR